MSISISSVVGPKDWNNGFVERSGIKLLPIKLNNNTEVIFSNLGGNILAFNVGGKEKPVEITQCALDFSNPNFDLSSLLMMGQIRGLTPPMYPGVGRITELPNGNDISSLNEINGYRQLVKGSVGIHGAAHNRLWEVIDDGKCGDSHKVTTTFNVSVSENADIFKVFGPGNVKRTYEIRPTAIGAKIEIRTVLSGLRVFGDHSYFNTPDRKDWKLQAKGVSLWEVNSQNNNVPTGKLIDGGMFNESVVLDKHFDGVFTGLGFQSTKPGPTETAILSNESSGMEIQITQNEPLTHRTIFTPMKTDGNPEDYTCVEPSTTSPDAYRLAKTIYGLATPNGTWSKEPIAFEQKIEVKFI